MSNPLLKQLSPYWIEFIEKSNTQPNAGRMKQSDEKFNQFFYLIEEGSSIQDACNVLEINRSTYYSWMRNFPSFKQGVQNARKSRGQFLIKNRKSSIEDTFKEINQTLKEILNLMKNE